MVTVQACTQPAGYSPYNTDCNDANAAVNPGAKEVCGNTTDENCDGQIGEGCSGNPFLVINPAFAYESQGLVNVTVNLSKKSTKAIKVNYRTVNQTATSPADYTSKTGTLTIPAGSQTGTISIIVINDNISEPTEYFTVVLSQPSNATVSVGTASIAILDGTAAQTTAAPATSPAVQNMSAKSANLVVDEPRLTVKAMPNPSANQFTLLTKSSSNESIIIRVTDIFGRVVESKRNVAANGTHIMGNRYRPGTYYVEILQGKNKIITKLVKLSD